MAGNKKPRRKTGRRKHTATKAEHHAAREQARVRHNMMIGLANDLPLGHEANRHKIEEVMTPLTAYLDELESTGDAPIDEEGRIIFWSDIDNDWILMGDAILSMCMMLDLVSHQFTWEAIPTGLRHLGSKIQLGEELDQHDTAAARAAIAWISDHIAEVTPNQWGEAYREAVRIVDERDAQQAALDAATAGEAA
jgi:hypothetical protein